MSRFSQTSFMSRGLKSLSSLIIAALFLASPLFAGPGGGGGGHGGGGGGHGGGGGGLGGGSSYRGGQGSGHSIGGGSYGGGRGTSPNAGRSSFGGQSGTRSVPGGHSAPGKASAARPGGGHPGHGGMPGGRSFAGHPGWHGGPGGPGFHPGWYHGDWHDDWVGPWHYGPTAWFSIGFVTGAVVWDAPWYWGYYPYYNPYYTEVIVVNGATIDYSQPIVVAAPQAAATVQPSLADDPAAALLEGARGAFARGDYPAAMVQVNQAIAQKPNDPLLHEFRALILFATRQYKASAEAAYAVLSVGPGWDWATLSGFYPDVNVYTTQLRALEQYRNQNVNLPEIRFLLAYHYMSCGHPEAAVIELKEVVKLNPKDQLAAQLLAGLSGEKPAAPAIATLENVAAPSPVSAANLVGEWDATRADGSTFHFMLTSGSAYAWKFTKGGKSQDYTGEYTVADGLLILKQGGKPVLIGQVTMLDANRFNFKLVGENPTDPGLTFTKKP